jgi:hypothetical protein
LIVPLNAQCSNQRLAQRDSRMMSKRPTKPTNTPERMPAGGFGPRRRAPTMSSPTPTNRATIASRLPPTKTAPPQPSQSQAAHHRSGRSLKTMARQASR